MAGGVHKQVCGIPAQHFQNVWGDPPWQRLYQFIDGITVTGDASGLAIGFFLNLLDPHQDSPVDDCYI